MKTYYFIIIYLSLSLKGLSQQFYNIPTQQIFPYKEMGADLYYLNKKDSLKMTIDSFEISQQISFGEYKKYLAEIKNDSSNSFYLIQLPDSSIMSTENYTKYVNDKKYDNYPVVGIRWDAAMNYCKWKTLKENKQDTIRYIYRLPKVSEWLSANKYLNDNLIENDFNKNYSDWTISAYYEGIFTNDFGDDAIYLANSSDPIRLKRSRVIGNSYLFQRDKLKSVIGYYQFNGYRQIAFRIVKEFIKESVNKKSTAQRLLEYWNIKK